MRPRHLFRYVLGLVTLGLMSPGMPAASDRTDLAHCYDPSRELLQKVAPAKCDGRIVSPEEATQIRTWIERRRFERASKAPRRARAAGPEKSGSGVLLTDAGHVVTAAHVVTGCRRIEVDHPSKPSRRAQVIARHPTADLALLRLPPGDRNPIKIAFEEPRELGPWMATIGYPNQGWTVIRPVRKEAKFAGLKALDEHASQQPLRIVFQGELRPGDSGGALVDEDERLVGVVIAQIDTPGVYATTGKIIRHVGFAEPIAAVRELLQATETKISGPKPNRSGTTAERSVFRVTCRPGGGRP